MIAIKYTGNYNVLVLYRDFGSSFRGVDHGWYVSFSEVEKEHICRFLEVSQLDKEVIKQFPKLYIKFLNNTGRILISKRNDLTLLSKDVIRNCKFLSRWGEKPGKINYYKESSDFIVLIGNINGSHYFIPELIMDKSELYHPLVNNKYRENYKALGFYDLSQSYDYTEEMKYKMETEYLKSISKKKLKELKKIPGHCKDCGRTMGTKLYFPFKKYGKDIGYYLCKEHCKKYINERESENP